LRVNKDLSNNNALKFQIYTQVEPNSPGLREEIEQIKKKET